MANVDHKYTAARDRLSRQQKSDYLNTSMMHKELADMQTQQKEETERRISELEQIESTYIESL